MALAQSELKAYDKRFEGEAEEDSRLSRNELITKYLPHVKRIVHRLAIHLPPTVDVEDLINVGVIGLIQAVDRYDPARDNQFLTYASFRIKGAVLSELRSRDYLSRSTRRKVRELDQAFCHLEQKFGRAVKEREVAQALGISLEQVYEIRKVSSISFISLEEVGPASREDKETLINDLLHAEHADALALTRLKELKDGLAQAIAHLPEKEKLVVSLYYGDELTMKEVGKVLHLTESRVSQIHSQAVVHLRLYMRKHGYID